MSHESMDAKGSALAIFLCLIFGSNAVAIKVSLVGIPPCASAAIRFMIASVIIYSYARFKKIDLTLSARDWGHVALMGILFGAQFTILYLGIYFTTVSHAAILMNTQPFFVAISAHFFLTDDRLNTRKILGIAAAFVGVIVMFYQGKHGATKSILGDLLVLIAAISWAGQTIYIKRWLDDWDPIPLVMHPMVIGVTTLAVAHFFFEKNFVLYLDRDIVISILYQSLFVAGFGYLAWTNLLLRYRASSLSAFIFLMPVSGVLLGTIFMGDPVTTRLIVGLFCITGGILLVNIKQKEAFVVPD
jgi:drug/metabolite transporter (DMT)-like permease